MSGRDDSPLFSRSGSTHFLGPCDAEQAVPMPETMKQHLNATAHLMDPPMSGAELSRIVLSDFLYGRLAQMQRTIRRTPLPRDPGKAGETTAENDK